MAFTKEDAIDYYLLLADLLAADEELLFAAEHKVATVENYLLWQSVCGSPASDIEPLQEALILQRHLIDSAWQAKFAILS